MQGDTGEGNEPRRRNGWPYEVEELRGRNGLGEEPSLPVARVRCRSQRGTGGRGEGAVPCPRDQVLSPGRELQPGENRTNIGRTRLAETVHHGRHLLRMELEILIFGNAGPREN